MPANNNAGKAANNGGAKSTPMTGSDASRIQSTQDKGGKDMSSEGFAARAQGGAAKNENQKK